MHTTLSESFLSIFLFLLTLSASLLCHLQAQSLSKKEQAYFAQHAVNIQVDSSYSHGTWDALLEQIGDKRIVLLGEFTHGAKEISVARNDLIQALHEDVGFDVVLFESGIGEVAAMDRYRDKLTPAQMCTGLMGPWQTSAFKDLMHMAKEKDISIAGFDVQRSGGSFERYLEIVAQEYELDTALYQSLEQRFSSIKSKLSNRKNAYEAVAPSSRTLIKDYQNLLNKFKSLQQAKPGNQSLLFAEQTLLNRIWYIQYRLAFLQDQDYHKRWEARDLAMAENIEWLLENIFPDRKVIIIAHNFHIAKYNKTEEVMGEFLHQTYREDMYVLGVFAAAGTYRGNYGEEKEISIADSAKTDIKHVIEALEGRLHVMDIRSRSSKRMAFLSRKIIVNDSFIDLEQSNRMVLNRHFDGLLLFDQVSASEPLRWE